MQNAIDLARACGVKVPKVGVLAAVETVNVNMPSTLDAVALSKMAERGQIKGIHSEVAGHADVLIAPNLEAGNMLAKELTFIARAEAAGLVVGARIPVMLTSRADNDRARLVSCVLAQLYEYWRVHGEALGDAEHALKAAE